MRIGGGGATKGTVPTDVLAAALICGSTCSVCKDPVTQVPLAFPSHRCLEAPERRTPHFCGTFSGCRCPEGQLLQDGRCVALRDCRCALPSGNATLQFLPGDDVSMDCNAW